MWRSIWPELPADEVPIRAVTNGVHIYSWTAREVTEMFDRYIGPEWRSDPLAPEIWRRIYEIPDDELWQVHSLRRHRLVAYTRQRLAKQLTDRGASPQEIQAAGDVLNLEALTIGFARRFATYKRATLLLDDIERLHKLVSHEHRPVQFIFAGKAHPHDEEGKRYIREIVHATREAGLQGRLVFLEDYDIEVARYMVQGCDVWLNNPRRPLEASGTSGMKAVLNGGLHCSTLDGWWAQAYSPEVGWAIGAGEEYEDVQYGDNVESNALYDLLEHDIAPLFWNRDPAHAPHDWIVKMRASMSNLIPRFCANRMVRNYVEEAYLPAARRYCAIADNNAEGARKLAVWRRGLETAWEGIHVARLEVKPGALVGGAEIRVNETVEVRATISLGGLTPDDITVEAYSGPIDNRGNFQNAVGIPMEYDSDNEEGLRFVGTLATLQSGHFGLTVRIFPHNEALPSKYSMFKVKWNEAS
jgi:starch phosphorylase